MHIQDGWYILLEYVVQKKCFDIIRQEKSLKHVATDQCALSSDYWPHSGDVLALRHICDELETKRSVLHFLNTGTLHFFSNHIALNVYFTIVSFWCTSLSMKSFFSCTDCVLPMNFGNGKLPASAFKAGSFKQGHAAARAGISDSLWCGASMKNGSWLQVDLGKVWRILSF